MINMGKKTVALNKEQYIRLIEVIRMGNFHYVSNDGKVRLAQSNERIAFALSIEANLGIRIGDVLDMERDSIIKDGDRYRLDIIEKKTGKKREFTVHDDFYKYFNDYCDKNSIAKGQKIFEISERAVQKHLAHACQYLGLEKVSTHSLRKFYATSIYKNSNCNIELVRMLLQHANSGITQKYIGISQKEVEEAIEKHNIIV